MDYVFSEGDQSYKSPNTINLLSVDDLPHTAQLFNMGININSLHLETRDVTLADGLPFVRCCAPHNICDGLLLFICGNTTAIVPRQNKLYLFNSHRRDGRVR